MGFIRKYGLPGVVCVVVAGTPLGGSGVVQPSDPLTPVDGQRLEEKAELLAHRATDENVHEPVVVYQREVNAYLRFQAAPAFPTGVTDSLVTLQDDSGVAVSATVDLSALRDARPRTFFDPLRYLSGSLPVSAHGHLRTENGVGRVEVGGVTIAGVPVPSRVLSELVRYYSRSEERPEGVDLGQPFELPYGVTELRVEHERAVVMQ